MPLPLQGVGMSTSTVNATSMENGVHDGVSPRNKRKTTTSQHPSNQLKQIAAEQGLDLTDVEFARYMDSQDTLHHLRTEFYYPKMKDLNHTDLSIVDPEEDCVYFCGNSLGLCPRKTKQYMDVEIDKWAKTGVQGHTHGDIPWVRSEELFVDDMAKLVGGIKNEVGMMNGLTVNLHMLLISFYRPTPKRYKIMLESKAFPSDHYAIASQIHLHGYDPKSAMVIVEPREGEETIRHEDILSRIEAEGESIAVICMGGVHYYTGQLFNMPAITKAGHKKGCYVGWDLAHAAGNVELHLHDWEVDFACWCTYKYLNCGAGSLAGLFIHEKHKDNDFPKLKGWWGHKLETRFKMTNEWDSYTGANQYRCSNTAGFLCPSVKASLEIFNKTSISELRKKSLLLTGYLEMLILKRYGRTDGENAGEMDNDWKHVHVDIITPSDPQQRGAQLSLSFSVPIEHVFTELEKRGVVCDERKPNVIRISPAPLYCSFRDVYRCIELLDQSLQAAAKSQNNHI